MEAVKTRLGKVEKEFEEKAQVADEKLKARQDEGDRVVENDVVMMKETLSMLEDMGVVKSKVENEMKLAGTRVTEELARMESAMNWLDLGANVKSQNTLLAEALDSKGTLRL